MGCDLLVVTVLLSKSYSIWFSLFFFSFFFFSLFFLFSFNLSCHWDKTVHPDHFRCLIGDRDPAILLERLIQSTILSLYPQAYVCFHSEGCKIGLLSLSDRAVQANNSRSLLLFICITLLGTDYDIHCWVPSKHSVRNSTSPCSSSKMCDQGRRISQEKAEAWSRDVYKYSAALRILKSGRYSACELEGQVA